MSLVLAHDQLPLLDNLRGRLHNFRNRRQRSCAIKAVAFLAIAAAVVPLPAQQSAAPAVRRVKKNAAIEAAKPADAAVPAVGAILKRRARPVNFQNPRQDGLDSLLPQLEVELLFVKKFCAPTEERTRAIAEDLEKCLTDAANHPENASCDLLPDRLVACVAKHLSKPEAARYRAEVEKRRIHEREACIDTFITLLDQDLCFSARQRTTLVASLTPNWKPAWSQMIELAVRNGDTELPPVPDQLIVPLLDREQANVWKRLPKCQQIAPAFDALRIGAVGTPVVQPEDE